MKGDKLYHYVAESRDPNDPNNIWLSYSGVILVDGGTFNPADTPLRINEDYARIQDAVHAEMYNAMMRKYGKRVEWLTVKNIQIMSLTRID